MKNVASVVAFLLAAACSGGNGTDSVDGSSSPDSSSIPDSASGPDGVSTSSSAGLVGEWKAGLIPAEEAVKGATTVDVELSLGPSGKYTLGYGVIYNGPEAGPELKNCIVVRTDTGIWYAENIQKPSLVLGVMSTTESINGCRDPSRNQEEHPVSSAIGTVPYPYGLTGDTLIIVGLLPVGAFARQ